VPPLLLRAGTPKPLAAATSQICFALRSFMLVQGCLFLEWR
jgi:hypothetical protein